MKREDLKKLLEGKVADENHVKEIVDEIMKMNGNDINSFKAKSFDNDELTKENAKLLAELNELKESTKEFESFKKKATEFDDVNSKYQELVKEKEYTNKVNIAKSHKIKDKYIKMAINEIGDSEDLDAAFKKFADENVEMCEEEIIKGSSNPSLKGSSSTETDDDVLARFKTL